MVGRPSFHLGPGLFSGPMSVVGRVRGTTVLPIKKCRPCPRRYQAPKEKRFAKEFLEFFGGSDRLVPLKKSKRKGLIAITVSAHFRPLYLFYPQKTHCKTPTSGGSKHLLLKP